MTDLPPVTPSTQWTCRVCGSHWVVPELARYCETKDLEFQS